MKKVYSKRTSQEGFALTSEQIDIFRKFGYFPPSPKEIEADAGAVITVMPPERKLSYVVFNFKTGEFAIRTHYLTLKDEEITAFFSDFIQAALIRWLLEAADPDRVKFSKSGTTVPSALQLAEIFKAAFAKAFYSAANPDAAAVGASIKTAEAEPREVEE